MDNYLLLVLSHISIIYTTIYCYDSLGTDDFLGGALMLGIFILLHRFLRKREQLKG
jgi:hypothetical protein